MKKRLSITLTQTLAACLALILFASATLLLFLWQNDDHRFQKLTTQLFHEKMQANTLNMHYTLANPSDFGIQNYDTILPYYDKENAQKAQHAIRQLLDTLQQLQVENLSPTNAYTYRLLTRSLTNDLALGENPYFAEPLSPHAGMQSQLPILLAEYSFRCERDIQDYLKLLEQTDTYFASLLTYEQEKAQAGLLMPAVFLNQVKEQCDSILTQDSLNRKEHFLQTTFQERLLPLIDSGLLTQEAAQKYTVQNDRLLRTVLLPAYENLADGLFLLLDDSIAEQGLSAKTGGDKYYEALLCAQTGSYRTIAEIKQLLTQTFRDECRTIQKLLLDHPDLATLYRQEPVYDFPLTTADEMLLDLQERMAENFPPFPHTQSGLSSDTMPHVTLKTISPSLEKYSAPAFYLTAPLDDTQNHVIYLNPQQAPTGFALYTTLAHEGYPGHLYQTVYANQHTQLHNDNLIRQTLSYSGYQEGWALYAEFTAYQYVEDILLANGQERNALYADLEQHKRSLQLCLYCLLDLMIHYENISSEKAGTVLDSLGITDPLSQEAIYRYILEEPCNYLKYYLSYLEILVLRKEAQDLWAAEYSDLRFHTFFLDCGPSDFATLREELFQPNRSALSVQN